MTVTEQRVWDQVFVQAMWRLADTRYETLRSFKATLNTQLGEPGPEKERLPLTAEQGILEASRIADLAIKERRKRK